MGLALARAGHTFAGIAKSPASVGVGALVGGATVVGGLSLAAKYTFDEDFPREQPVIGDAGPAIVALGIVGGALGVIGLAISGGNKRWVTTGAGFMGASAGAALGATLVSGMAEKMMS